MQRELSQPRQGWNDRVNLLGMTYAETEGKPPYWNEGARYRFTLDEIETVEAATHELHHMCLNAVQHVIDKKLYSRLAIPEKCVPYIETTWNEGHRFIYGRFDLAYDGKSPPKMLEYNADTPTALYEAAVVQWDWLQAMKKAKALPVDADQFNFIHESLIAAWKKVAREIGNHGEMHFACQRESIEDNQTTEYMMDVAQQAGIRGKIVDVVGDVGHNGLDFVDEKNQPIYTMFKLYPWEDMAASGYSDQAMGVRTRFFEPAWKMILSNKGILPILWEMYPGHKNLLPAFDNPGAINGPYVKKPLLSREGANIEIVAGEKSLSTGGDYGKEGHIYQAFHELPNFNGHYPVIGSWVTSNDPRFPEFPRHPRGGDACGMGVREDDTRITRNDSRFVPHYING